MKGLRRAGPLTSRLMWRRVFLLAVLVMTVTSMPVEQVHERAGEQNEVRNDLRHVSQMLRQKVIDAKRARNEHEDP